MLLLASAGHVPAIAVTTLVGSLYPPWSQLTPCRRSVTSRC